MHGSSVLYNSGTFYLWPIVAVAALQRRPIVAVAALQWWPIVAGAFVLVGDERNYIQWVDDTVHLSGVATLFAGFQHIVLVCICSSGSCKKSADMTCERGKVAKSVLAQSKVKPCENGSAHG